ncbi:MAG TPA: alpha/beta fold hydrolase [Nitriliruptorales bacterium]|nr:alpha/beta fold hydrolase [Nitriliruptorales bacterium]
MVFTVRTPDERFDGLPDWPYVPRYEEVGGLRLARVDEGGGEPVVLVHGVPTWGYLWRHVLPPLLDAGLRVVVPDQVGFGRSDKPARRGWYNFDRLVDSFAGHLAAVAPPPVTLVVHDWGGPVGLRWAVEHPGQVARLVLLDTAVWAPGGRHSPAWRALRRLIAGAEQLPIGQMVDGACLTDVPAPVQAAYEAPFPGPEYQAGPLALPLLVPRDDHDPEAAQMAAVRAALARWDRPTLILWGAHDPFLPLSVARRFARDIPSAGQVQSVRASHLVQEDAGPEVGARIARFVATS